MPTFTTAKNRSSLEEVRAILSNCLQEGECLIWRGAFNTDGYPRATRKRVSTGQSYSNVKVHRHIFEHIHQTRLFESDIICHSCDDPRCLNPSHISVGTASSNMQDRDFRGRTFNAVSCLEIDSIKELSFRGFSGVCIAKQLGINVKRVYYVLRKYKGD